MVEKVLVMADTVSQLAVAAVLFTRANAPSTDTVDLVGTTFLAQYPRPVGVRFDPEGCFVSREWTDMLTSLDFMPDPTAKQAHHPVR